MERATPHLPPMRGIGRSMARTLPPPLASVPSTPPPSRALLPLRPTPFPARSTHTLPPLRAPSNLFRQDARQPPCCRLVRCVSHRSPSLRVTVCARRSLALLSIPRCMGLGARHPRRLPRPPALRPHYARPPAPLHNTVHPSACPRHVSTLVLPLSCHTALVLPLSSHTALVLPLSCHTALVLPQPSHITERIIIVL